MHSDGVVLKKDAAEDVSSIVDSKLQRLGSAWGVAFTHYDILAFYHTKARPCKQLETALWEVVRQRRGPSA